MSATDWVTIIGAVAGAAIAVLKAWEAKGHAASAQAARTRAEAAWVKVMNTRQGSEPPVPAETPVPADTEAPGGVIG